MTPTGAQLAQMICPQIAVNVGMVAVPAVFAEEAPRSVGITLPVIKQDPGVWHGILKQLQRDGLRVTVFLDVIDESMYHKELDNEGFNVEYFFGTVQNTVQADEIDVWITED